MNSTSSEGSVALFIVESPLRGMRFGFEIVTGGPGQPEEGLALTTPVLRRWRRVVQFLLRVLVAFRPKRVPERTAAQSSFHKPIHKLRCLVRLVRLLATSTHSQVVVKPNVARFTRWKSQVRIL
jgi:hypothetical protein